MGAAAGHHLSQINPICKVSLKKKITLVLYRIQSNYRGLVGREQKICLGFLTGRCVSLPTMSSVPTTTHVAPTVPAAIRGSDGRPLYKVHFSTAQIYKCLNMKVKDKFSQGNFQIEFMNSYYHPDLQKNLRAVIRSWVYQWNKDSSRNLHVAYLNYKEKGCGTVIDFKLMCNYTPDYPKDGDEIDDEEFIVGQLDNPEWSGDEWDPDNASYESDKLYSSSTSLPVIHPSRSERVQNRNSFWRFKQARIRRDVGAKTPLKDIMRAYKSYTEEFRQAGEKSLSGSELEEVISDEFGTPTDGKTFSHIRLFYSDENAKEFDSENRVGE